MSWRVKKDLILDTLKSKTSLATDSNGKVIEGTPVDLTGYWKSDGTSTAMGNWSLAGYNLSNVGTLGAGATTLTGNLLFTDASYDIGASGATRPRNLYLSGNATIGGLTAGRLPYIGTDGLLSNTLNLTYNSTTNLLTLNTGQLSITGTNSGSGAASNVLTVAGGQGQGTGKGSNISLTSGVGGAWAGPGGTSGAGGDVSLITSTGGSGSTSVAGGKGGDLYLTTAAGAAAGGPAGGVGGGLIVSLGAGGASAGSAGKGGSMSFTSGTGGAASGGGGSGGDITLTSGSGAGGIGAGVGGIFTMTSGAGGDANSSGGAGNAAGSFTLSGGRGGNTTNPGLAANGGAGGSATLSGGAGGTSVIGAGGAGGSFYLLPGLGGVGGGGNGATSIVGICVNSAGTSTGNCGVGMKTPTARLHLAAGTATASTAPLKFTSGPLLTAAELGTIEYYSSKFYIRGTEGLAFGAAGEYINSANANYLDLNATTGIRLNRATSTAYQITSTLAGGTSPFAVTSTTVNTNLNADMVDGLRFYKNSGTLTAGTTTTVTDTNAKTTSVIILQATSLGITALQPYISTKNNGSFVITTLTAAGTETFDYILVN